MIKITNVRKEKTAKIQYKTTDFALHLAEGSRSSDHRLEKKLINSSSILSLENPKSELLLHS